MMSKMKSKKSIASCGLQSDISAFFAKVLPKSPKRGTAMHTDMYISNVIKTSPGPDTRFPLSPLTIPETPEREKQHHCPTQLFSGASRSPVARSPRSRGLLPHKTSPKSGDIVKADISIEHFGSAKRLMHGSETLQKAKRPRTGPIQPRSGKNSSSNEDGLSEFLQAIRETANSNDKKSAKAFSKAIEEKSCHAEQTLFVKNRSTLPDLMLRNITSAKESGANEPKDHNRNKRGSHSNVSSSLAEEKENIPVCTKPSTDLTETSIYNQSDLVMSYTSWSCDGDDGKKEEDAFVRVNEKNSQKATNCSNKVTNLGDKENANMTAEESFGLLDDSWFNDQMEQSLDEPDHKKSKLGKEKSIPEHVILASGLHNRYWVLDVQETTGAQGYTEKRLTITCSKSLHPTETCVLKDGWEDTPVAVGDIVHLEGECVSGLWMIDSKYGFLVLLPDVLVSGTSIANTVRCMRRAVLGEMFKSSDGGSRQMLNGTIVHDIFQKAAMSLDFSPEKLEKLASEALHSPNYLGQMYSLKLTQADMRQELEEYLTAISEWAKDYVHTSHQTRQKQLTMRL